LESDFRSRGILCMPIKNAQGHVIGVAQLTNKLDKTAFNKNDENLFEVSRLLFGSSYGDSPMYCLHMVKCSLNMVDGLTHGKQGIVLCFINVY